MAGERWIFTKAQIQNTPSRKLGLDAEKELTYRQQGGQLIQDMGQRLHVTQLCINTAIVYLHRFYMFHSFQKFHRNEMAPACLFLAAKVEEQPRKLEHVVSIWHKCINRDDPPLDTKSEKYLEKAQELVINENILLQTLGFEITVDHPHTHVIKTCQLVRASKDLTQTSYFLATNSLHLTTMSLEHKPTVVSCVAIHLACKWSSWEVPKSSEGKYWWSYVDKSVTYELLEDLVQDFLNIIDKCPTKLKQKIMNFKANTAGPDMTDSSSHQARLSQRKLEVPQTTSKHPTSSQLGAVSATAAAAGGRTIKVPAETAVKPHQQVSVVQQNTAGIRRCKSDIHLSSMSSSAAVQPVMSSLAQSSGPKVPTEMQPLTGALNHPPNHPLSLKDYKARCLKQQQLKKPEEKAETDASPHANSSSKEYGDHISILPSLGHSGKRHTTTDDQHHTSTATKNRLTNCPVELSGKERVSDERKRSHDAGRTRPAVVSGNGRSQHSVISPSKAERLHASQSSGDMLQKRSYDSKMAASENRGLEIKEQRSSSGGNDFISPLKLKRRDRHHDSSHHDAKSDNTGHHNFFVKIEPNSVPPSKIKIMPEMKQENLTKSAPRVEKFREEQNLKGDKFAANYVNDGTSDSGLPSAPVTPKLSIRLPVPRHSETELEPGELAATPPHTPCTPTTPSKVPVVKLERLTPSQITAARMKDVKYKKKVDPIRIKLPTNSHVECQPESAKEKERRDRKRHERHSNKSSSVNHDVSLVSDSLSEKRNDLKITLKPSSSTGEPLKLKIPKSRIKWPSSEEKGHSKHHHSSRKRHHSPGKSQDYSPHQSAKHSRNEDSPLFSPPRPQMDILHSVAESLNFESNGNKSISSGDVIRHKQRHKSKTTPPVATSEPYLPRQPPPPPP